MTRWERRLPDGTLQSYDLYWDGPDNLRQINVHGGSEIWAAGYNGDGLRVSLQDTASGSFPTQHNYTLGLGGLLYDAYQSAVYTPGVSQRVSGADTFFHTDWLGSTRYLSDSPGNTFPNALRYDAFGNRSAYGGTYDPTPFQYAGGYGYQTEYADASANEPGVGLQYLQQRYYDPVVGRFISPDPIGFAGGLNRYGYADDDPVNAADPSGLQDEEPFKMPDEVKVEVKEVEDFQALLEKADEWHFRQILRQSGVTPEQWMGLEGDLADQLVEKELKGQPASLRQRYPWLRPIRSAPNPGGRRGCPAHRDVVAQEEAGWRASG
jgi:RHS repeat-associated protein